MTILAASPPPSALAIAARLNDNRAARAACAAAPGAPIRLGPTPVAATAAAVPNEVRTAADGADDTERLRSRTGRAQLLVFRVGAERFGLPLARVEEAVEVGAVYPLPGGGLDALGVVEVRGRMVPLFAARRVLGVTADGGAAMLVLRDGTRRVGVAVDDVDDVLAVDCATLAAPPDADGVVVGIARRGDAIVAVLDADALLGGCLAAATRLPESAV